MLAFVSLTPFAIFVSYITLIIFKRELDTVIGRASCCAFRSLIDHFRWQILFCIGQLLNEFLNVLLKNIIREQRPVHELVGMHTPKTYGMPSQHSQYQTFFTVFCLLFIAIKLSYKPWYYRLSCYTFLITSLFAVIYSR